MFLLTKGEIMLVPSPMFISGRLMAALKLEGVGQLEVSESGRWRIEDSTGAELDSGADLCCPCANDYGNIMASLLGFLGAAAEAYRYGPSSENFDLFSPAAMEWAYMNSEELFMAEYELEETVSS